MGGDGNPPSANDHTSATFIDSSSARDSEPAMASVGRSAGATRPSVASPYSAHQSSETRSGSKPIPAYQSWRWRARAAARVVSLASGGPAPGARLVVGQLGGAHLAGGGVDLVGTHDRGLHALGDEPLVRRVDRLAAAVVDGLAGHGEQQVGERHVLEHHPHVPVHLVVVHEEVAGGHGDPDLGGAHGAARGRGGHVGLGHDPELGVVLVALGPRLAGHHPGSTWKGRSANTRWSLEAFTSWMESNGDIPATRHRCTAPSRSQRAR